MPMNRISRRWTGCWCTSPAPAAAASIFLCPASRDRAADERAFLPDRSLPVCRYAANRPGHRRDRRAARPREGRWRVPKIFYTNTSYEYWSRAGSLIHTSPDGKRDQPLMDNVRIYFLAGLQHFTPPFPPVRDTERGLAPANVPNPNPVRWFWRALFRRHGRLGARGQNLRLTAVIRSLPTKYSLGRAT